MQLGQVLLDLPRVWSESGFPRAAESSRQVGGHVTLSLLPKPVFSQAGELESDLCAFCIRSLHGVREEKPAKALRARRLCKLNCSVYPCPASTSQIRTCNPEVQIRGDVNLRIKGLSFVSNRLSATLLCLFWLTFVKHHWKVLYAKLLLDSSF